MSTTHSDLMLSDATQQGVGISVADVPGVDTAIWAGLDGPHVVVTMTGVRAIELAATLARCDTADSVEIDELVQALTQATEEREALFASAHRSSFGTFLRGRWLAKPRSIDADMAHRTIRQENEDDVVNDATPEHTYAPAEPRRTLETINPAVVDAWSSGISHGERRADLPTIHVSAEGAKTAAIVGSDSVDASEPSEGIHDVSAEIASDETADRLKAAARVADVVATAAGQAAVVETASQSALETATQAREAAIEAARAAATAAAASIKFELVVKEAAEAARAKAESTLDAAPMLVPAIST